jgi:GT2 family glycosyltransferase
MKYSIIIPTYNHCDDFLKPCVQGVLENTHMQEVELIISANGCTDGTMEYLSNLQHHFTSLGFEKNFRVVWSDAPLGYAGAVNAALKESTGELIVLLNNDAFILPHPRHDWLNRLVKPFEQYSDCGISCLIKGFSEPANSEFAVFFCVMIHRKVFDKLGPLSMDYGVGAGEDTEFCVEALRAGFTIHEIAEKTWSEEIMLWTNNFPLYHKGGGTVHDETLVPEWSKIFHANSCILAAKYNPEWLIKNHVIPQENDHVPSNKKIPTLVGPKL